MSTDQKTINAYNAYASKWSEGHKTDTNYHHVYNEKPAMYAKLGDLTDKDVLCLGCGTGEECEFISSLNPKRIVGTDIAEKLIEEAKKNYPDLEFYVKDMENPDFPENSFDLVYSSLAVHYIEDWTNMLSNIYKILKPGGRFLFSTTHPLLDAMVSEKQESGKKLKYLGYIRSNSLENTKVFGDYLNDQKIEDHQLTEELQVTCYYKSISLILKYIFKSGFTLTDFIETKPLEKLKDVMPGWYEVYSKMPQFLVIEVTKE